MKDLWKLQWSLYTGENNTLSFRKGQVAERIVITDEIRQLYNTTDTKWLTMYLFKNGKFILCEHPYNANFKELELCINPKRRK